MDSIEEYTTKLQKYYMPLIKKYGISYQSVNWGSESAQDLRLEILLQIAPLYNASILDIGCGMGRLVDHLKKLNFKGSYHGVDLLEDMVTWARKNHPGWNFITGNALSKEPNLSADYVLGSGLFTLSNEKEMRSVISAMFECCHKGVAVNSLSSWSQKNEPGEFYADPLETVKYCKELSPKVILRHDYMNHDFTVYLYK